MLTGWDVIDANKYADETAVVRGLLDRQPLSADDRRAILAEATAPTAAFLRCWIAVVVLAPLAVLEIRRR